MRLRHIGYWEKEDQRVTSMQSAWMPEKSAGAYGLPAVPGIAIGVLMPCNSGGVPSKALVFCATATCHVAPRFSATMVIIPKRGGRGVPSKFLSPVIFQ